MSSPVISCVMPVYNAEAYLARAIESIFAQTFADFELIAVDDGSTDGSCAILRGYEKKDKRLHVISRGNTGIVGALNDGIAAARGKYIARMDGDDVCAAERFARQVEYLEKHPDCVLVGSRVVMMDSQGWEIGDMPTVENDHDAIVRALLDGGWPIIHPAIVMRRDAVLKAGGYRAGMFPNEDHDLFIRLIDQGRLHNLPEPLLQYRRHFQSVSLGQGRQGMLEKIVDEARARRGMEPRPKKELPPMTQRVQREVWAWTALQSGHVATARKHALGLVKEKPWSKDSWRVMYCAIRGH